MFELFKFNRGENSIKEVARTEILKLEKDIDQLSQNTAYYEATLILMDKQLDPGAYEEYEKLLGQIMRAKSLMEETLAENKDIFYLKYNERLCNC